MPWVHRGISKSNNYYYLTCRVSGGFRCDYLGKGPFAEWVAESVAERKRLRLDAQALRRELQSLERSIIAYNNGVHSLFAAWMRVSGWHRHRGTWRRTG